MPQLIYKGSILKSWSKKQAVAIHSGFYKTLPKLKEVEPEIADMAWLVYDLALDEQNRYKLALKQTIYTHFKPALDQITTPEPGPMHDFVDHLQDKLDKILDDENNSPDAPSLDELL